MAQHNSRWFIEFKKMFDSHHKKACFKLITKLSKSQRHSAPQIWIKAQNHMCKPESAKPRMAVKQKKVTTTS